MKIKNIEVEKFIIGARILLDSEIANLVGSSHEQFGYEGIKYSIKEMKRLARVVKRDLHNNATLKEVRNLIKNESK